MGSDIVTSLVQGAIICSATWVLWKFFRQWVVKSPLDNIPGPERTTFLQGNLTALFDRHGWQFHHELATRFPGVAKYYGPFGVCALRTFVR